MVSKGPKTLDTKGMFLSSLFQGVITPMCYAIRILIESDKEMMNNGHGQSLQSTQICPDLGILHMSCLPYSAVLTRNIQ